MKSLRWLFGFGVVAVLPAIAAAQAPTIDVGQVDCLPQGGNAVATATVTGSADAGSTVRLYFRRMNNLVEDFYYVEMQPSGGGEWWATFPRPENAKLPEKRLRDRDQDAWAAWWKAKEASDDRDPNDDLDDQVIRERASRGKQQDRSWMTPQTDEQLQDWLESLANEPAEYYAALVDPTGRELAKSAMHASMVRSDCRVQLTPPQIGYARNLTIGETAAWQENEEVFHWQCEGIVTRIDDQGILRADQDCRACVVAWWKQKQFLIPAAVVLGTGIVLIDDDDPPVSPTRPGA
jgi:hypothetical protein